MPVADTRHGPIEHVLIDGDPSRAPLVFLHGGLGCVAAWGRFPAAVAAATGRRALVYSRPGSGGSGPARIPATPRYMHEQGQRFLPELLDLLDLHDPVLVGHSDGASTALLYASVRPAEAVVAMGPHLYFEEANRTGIEAARAAYEAGPLYRKLSLVHDDPRGVFTNWSELWLSEDFRTWSIEDDLNVTAPVLMIQGDRDEYGTLGQLDALQRVARGPVRRVVPEGADHYPHLVRPELVIDAITRFLADHTPGTPATGGAR